MNLPIAHGDRAAMLYRIHRFVGGKVVAINDSKLPKTARHIMATVRPLFRVRLSSVSLTYLRPTQRTDHGCDRARRTPHTEERRLLLQLVNFYRSNSGAVVFSRNDRCVIARRN